ncbi:hypothetical protein KEJ35_08945 [Candidatus Bathyarchaeota archaeon]|nr:hypothetical protein [Candidatus Bathyarchaeota archaeon]
MNIYFTPSVSMGLCHLVEGTEADNACLELTRSYRSALSESNDFQEIFEIVKLSVKESLGLERSGLTLHIRDLPVEVGAFHKIGTDIIVLNRRLVDIAVRVGASIAEIKALIFSVLLHEYLHSLGIYREEEVRLLTYDISRRLFGGDHPATILARMGPWALLNRKSRNTI